jgi:hypothetical protein
MIYNKCNQNISLIFKYDRIYQWLQNCSEIRALDFDAETKINDGLNRAINTGYLPISLNNPLKEPRTLKTENRDLYDIIKV